MIPEFNGISSLYVFYDRLKEDGGNSTYGNMLKGLYTHITNEVDKYINYYNDKDSPIVEKLLSMSAAELTKEQTLLNQVFGIPIKNINFSSIEDIKELITDFNRTLNLKKIFDRNVARIKGRKGQEDSWKNGKKKTGQINIASFFDDYFNQRLQTKKIIDIINEYRTPEDLINLQAENEIKNYLFEVSKLALTDMFKSKEFEKQIGKTDDAYLELIPLLENWKEGSNELINSLWETYNIETIIDEIKEISKEDNVNSAGFLKEITNKSNKIISANRYARGGLSLEYFENFLSNALIGKHLKNEGIEINIEGKSTHTGQTEMKADNIITFGIDTDTIQNSIADLVGKRISRENIVYTMNRLSNQLSKINDGFIIYSSAKNYSDSYSFKGFSAGEPISAQTYMNIIGDSNKIGAIFQTINGALYSEVDDEKIKLSIAEDIAYFLFDDFISIGKETNGVKSLHLFDLDGIYIPLSVLLYKIAAAIDEVQKLPTRTLSIDIYKPKNILYPDPPEGGYTRQHWDQQRQDALKNTKISFHFLKDFFDIIREM